MKTIESKVKIPEGLPLAEAIKFYRANLSYEMLRECEVAEGTEQYVDMLVEKYRESLRC